MWQKTKPVELSVEQKLDSIQSTVANETLKTAIQMKTVIRAKVRIAISIRGMHARNALAYARVRGGAKFA